MAKSGKIKELELTTINEQNVTLQKIVFDLGALDIQKSQLMQQYESALEALEKTKQSLEAKYGAVNINLKTGVWEEIEEVKEEVKEEKAEDCDDCGEPKKEDCEDCEDKE